MDDQLPPPLLLYQLATGHYVSQAIYVAAALGIADLLADGPRAAEELARSTGTDAPSLRRVLRLLASAGVLRETDDGMFDLTPIGSCLQSGPGSFRAVGRETLWVERRWTLPEIGVAVRQKLTGKDQ